MIAPVTLKPFIPLVLITVLLALNACKRQQNTAGGTERSDGSTVIQVQGSDTMVNLAQAWAEAYRKVDPSVSVEVGGGGSGVGIAALINGTVDLANSSRDMKPDERTKARNQHGKEVSELIVGYDALAIYVHKSNPLAEISIEQLASIYSEDGKLLKWSDLGVSVPGCSSDEVIRVSRQSSSGTYEFFREHVLNKKDFRLGSRDMNGSKEVVELVSNTPCAIGYSGMGYSTEHVKMLPVSAKPGTPHFSPSIENAQNKSYPLARPLFVYTIGAPEGAVKKYVEWILSEAGQKIVQESGYVPLRPSKPAQ